MWRVLVVVVVFAGCGDGDGPCAGGCECTADTDCAAPHTGCVDHVTSRTCDCVAGYAMGAGGCAWSGVVDDPGFDQASSRWTGVAPNPTFPRTTGMLDPGVLSLNNAYPCSVQQATQQVITMPRRSRAEPLVLRATSQASLLGHGPAGAEPLFGFGSSSFAGGAPVDFNNNFMAFGTSSYCLGATAYAPESTIGPGASITLAVSSECAITDSGHSALVTFDHLDIAPATPEDDCPDPGPVRNGDAEADGGWTFLVSSTNATAGFAEGVGENQSRGVMLHINETCDLASASVPIWVPLADATGAPSLTLYHASSGAGFQVALATPGARSVQAVPLTGNGSATVDHFCLPAPLRGIALRLQVTLTGTPRGLRADPGAGCHRRRRGSQ